MAKLTLSGIMRKHREDFRWLKEHAGWNDADWDMTTREWELESESRDKGGSYVYACPTARVTISQSEPIVELF